MHRAWSTAAIKRRNLTKIHPFVARSPTPPNAIGFKSALVVANARRVSSIAGNGPSASVVLTAIAGLPIALWTYKVGLSAV